MTVPTQVDHVLMAVVLAAIPIAGLLEYRWLERAVASARPNARVFAYRWVTTFEWILAVTTVAVWIRAGRPIVDLGLGIERTTGLWVGVGLALVAVIVLHLQVRAVTKSEAVRKSVVAQLRHLAAILPRDDREAFWFGVLSVTAGICEEIVYRGFVLSYVAAFAGTGAAVVVSSIVFGLAHAYQGGAGMLRTGAVGLVLALGLVLTGSLWIPMLVHAALDIASGAMARAAPGDAVGLE